MSLLSWAIMASVWGSVVFSLFTRLSELRAEVEALRALYEVNAEDVRALGSRLTKRTDDAFDRDMASVLRDLTITREAVRDSLGLPPEDEGT